MCKISTQLRGKTTTPVEFGKVYPTRGTMETCQDCVELYPIFGKLLHRTVANVLLPFAV